MGIGRNTITRKIQELGIEGGGGRARRRGSRDNGRLRPDHAFPSSACRLPPDDPPEPRPADSAFRRRGRVGPCGHVAHRPGSAIAARSSNADADRAWPSAARRTAAVLACDAADRRPRPTRSRPGSRAAQGSLTFSLLWRFRRRPPRPRRA
ncbi:MAG: hypothetical protein MZW92_75740 [Comamonadaceae bacterium]|nr:hypothetical protein [Comamonadaceae bacterium]